MPDPENRKTPDHSVIPKENHESTDVPELLDWEASIETPPVRPSGTVRARLRYQGRGKPIPIDDPRIENAKRAT